MIFAVLTASLLNAGQIAPSEYLWSKKVVEIISTHDVRTVEELVPVLPDQLKQRTLFAYDGQALLGSSPDNPRPVLFESLSGFTLTFKSSNLEAGPDAVEAMEWDGERIRFLAIEFPLEDPQNVNWKEPQKCQSCHGQKLSRPIWGEYPEWPGYLGADDDKISPSEANIMTQLKTNHGNNPRIASLLQVFDRYPNSPYLPPNAQNSHTQTWTHMRPNENFGEIATRMTARQLGRYFEPIPASQKAQIALHLAGCKDGDISEVIQSYGLSWLDFDLRFSFDDPEAHVDPVTSYFDGSALLRELVAAQLLQQLAPAKFRSSSFGKLQIYPARFPGNQPAIEILTTIDSWGRWIPSPFDENSPLEISRIRGVWPRSLERRFQRACKTLQSMAM